VPEDFASRGPCTRCGMGNSIEVEEVWCGSGLCAPRHELWCGPGEFVRPCARVAGRAGRGGDGKQYVSWVHETDFVNAVRWLIGRTDVNRPVNVCSPGALSNAEFMQLLREAAGVRIGLPATRWMLEVGATLMRTELELVLKSRRVWPGRLLDAGFSFQFPEWGEAARELVGSVG
jgi:NAD dependent epimerase/dehydratase family enzyme